MHEESPGATSPYWFGDDDIRNLLEALRAFRLADSSMRRRTARAMDMNESDMMALQLVVAAERHGTVVTPNAIALHLDISTASTTKLVDRLESGGYLVREPHPTDRRSVQLRPTAHAHDEIRARLTHMHAEMERVARAVPEASRGDVATFLRAVAEILERQEGIAPLT